MCKIDINLIHLEQTNKLLLICLFSASTFKPRQVLEFLAKLNIYDDFIYYSFLNLCMSIKNIKKIRYIKPTNKNLFSKFNFI